MKLLKSITFLISVLTCTLLSAQEASKNFKISESELVDKDLSSKVITFAEDFIQPIMRGEVYDISIGEIKVVSEYQKNNPIKCGFDVNLTFSRNGCHDRNSYYKWHDIDLFNEEPGTTFDPFNTVLNKYEINPKKSLIVPIKIQLKKDFQKNLINFLEAETNGMDYYSYNNLPLLWDQEAFNNAYIRCMRSDVPRCKKSLGRYGGNLPNYIPEEVSPDSFVINFTNRKLEEVTFYNLKNYRQELLKTRKHRFLTNLCDVSGEKVGNLSLFSTSYRSQDHVRLNDIVVTFFDSDDNEIHRIIINTQQPTDSLGSTGSTYGIAYKNNFIFAYDYGSNALKGKKSEDLGYRAMIGHLMTDTRRDFNRGCLNPVGVWADYPAFSLVSNYEYNLIVELNEKLIQQVSSVDIKYVTGSASTDVMAIHR